MSASDRLGRLAASANLAMALNVAGEFVPDARRDEFEAAVAVVIGCLFDMPPDEIRTMGIKVRAEIDTEAARKRAAQS